MALPHAVDRIEAIGANAVVIGSDGTDLYFDIVVLSNSSSAPSLGGRMAIRGTSQGETRTHGFFYKAEALGAGQGVLGLPVRGEKELGWSQRVGNSASVAFVRVDSAKRMFGYLGQLSARDGGAEDHCVASCVDWYGNARPIFYRGRVFALLGYEVVEGTLSESEVAESQRTHLMPSARGAMVSLKHVQVPQVQILSVAEIEDGVPIEFQDRPRKSSGCIEAPQVLRACLVVVAWVALVSDRF